MAICSNKIQVINLPEEFCIYNSKSVNIYDYRSSKEIEKQQIILNQHTFSFLIEGGKEVFFDNSTLSIDNSKFLMLKSGHCLMTEKLSKFRNYRSILMFFSNERLINFIKKNELQSFKSNHYNSACAFNYDKYIYQLVKSLLDISKLSKDIQNRMIDIKFEEILLYLIELNGANFLFSFLLDNNDKSQKIVQTVQKYWNSNLTLKELAFMSNMSISTFKREFDKYYQESPIKWIKNKRLEYARDLILYEQKNPSEVYFEIGYENLSSFIQAYKIKFGVTPKQHKK